MNDKDNIEINNKNNIIDTNDKNNIIDINDKNNIEINDKDNIIKNNINIENKENNERCNEIKKEINDKEKLNYDILLQDLYKNINKDKNIDIDKYKEEIEINNKELLNYINQILCFDIRMFEDYSTKINYFFDINNKIQKIISPTNKFSINKFDELINFIISNLNKYKNINYEYFNFYWKFLIEFIKCFKKHYKNNGVKAKLNEKTVNICDILKNCCYINYKLIDNRNIILNFLDETKNFLPSICNKESLKLFIDWLKQTYIFF